MFDINTPVQYVKGVGPKKAEALAKVGIFTVYDLLLYLPFRYEDRSQRLLVKDIQSGQNGTIEVEVVSLTVRQTRRRNFKVVELLAQDETGQLKAIWFNQEYLKETLIPHRRLLLYGMFQKSGYSSLPEVKNPQYELIEEGQVDSTHAGRVVPVYERIGSMSPKVLRKVLHFLVMGMPHGVPELLPQKIVTRYKLPLREQALTRVHFPEEDVVLNDYNSFRSSAQRRLIFEEFFLFFLALELRKDSDRNLAKKKLFLVNDSIRARVRKILPFRLTKAQRDVLKVVAKELASEKPMRRLVQGDVGSGKTIVGLLASLIVMEAGAQVAFMVPTELLAEQHFSTIHKLLTPLGYRVAMLSGNLKKTERDKVVKEIETGQVHFIIGTHALVQTDVEFCELGLAIVDEQHRFGVLQRNEIRKKGFGCDLIVMTATPIPRSLAMAIHGDLDVSVLNELPPGRQPIVTVRRDSSELKAVFSEIDNEVAQGRQVYFVCPLIEESESVDLKTAVERFKVLSEVVFASYRVALVHGRMSANDRKHVMDAFGRGDIDILVSTTVIEVGIDVPNATLIVIEHAERFGLSQLHQLRGRVGRGNAPSKAILLTYSPLTIEAERRLEVMVETNDGFIIAERDLSIRGPGDYFGTRQSGAPLFRVADILRDSEIRDQARQEARQVLESSFVDDFDREELLRHVRALWGDRFGLASSG